MVKTVLNDSKKTFETIYKTVNHYNKIITKLVSTMMKLINGLKERLSKVYNNLKEIKAEKEILKNFKKIFEMIINFDTVKNPGEFIRLNQKTINDGIDIFKRIVASSKKTFLY